MQIKKVSNKMSSDKIDRLNASLNKSELAEDALFKSALVFKTSSRESGLGRHVLCTKVRCTCILQLSLLPLQQRAETELKLSGYYISSYRVAKTLLIASSRPSLLGS